MTQPQVRGWKSFLSFVAEESERTGRALHGLSRSKGILEDGVLRICVPSRVLFDALNATDKSELLSEMCRSFFGEDVRVELIPPKQARVPTMEELKQKVADDPFFTRIMDEFQARIVEVRPNADRSSSG